MMKFRRIHLWWCTLGLLTLQTACTEDHKKVVKTEPITFTKEGELSIYKAQSDSVLTTLDIEIADTDYETQTGLMYRDDLADNQAMLFIFPDVAMHFFYMKNTKIPLDIIYIDEELQIASLKENAQPLDETGMSSEVPVKYVLEVKAGLASRWDLNIGDRISYAKIN